jgi:hypothetical protein
MPLENISPANIDPAELAAAAGITATTGGDYQLRDAYGVTYTGSGAHLTLSALARRDLTKRLYRADPSARAGVRASARRLLDWFTSPYVDPEHAAAFAALSPMRTCELVAYVASHARGDGLDHVGPESLRYYTGHLLDDPVPSLEHPMPRLIDKPYRSLDGGDNPRHPLQITATAADGGDEVMVTLDIEAHEEISWEFVAAIPIPVGELNELLMDPDYQLDDYLSDNRDLIDEYLVYRDSQTQEGVSVTATLASPRAALTYNQSPEQLIGVELFFVGPDRDTALTTAPYTSRDQAQQATGGEDRIFTAGVQVDADNLRLAA